MKSKKNKIKIKKVLLKWGRIIEGTEDWINEYIKYEPEYRKIVKVVKEYKIEI